MNNETISGLGTAIENADRNSTGKLTWDKDSRGLKFLFELVSRILWKRGVLNATNVESLSFIRGADASLVLVPKKGLYQFNLSNHPKTADDIQASGGGLWVKVLSDHPSYSKRLLGIISGTDTTIEHNLDTLFPNVHAYIVKNGGNERLQEPSYTITTIDSKSFKITWGDEVPTDFPIQIIVR